MNEQRTEAYLNLITQLLFCNEGDEPRILQKNQELLDRGLIEIMIAVAQQFEEVGKENEAQRLMNIAQQLAQALGLLEDETTATANTSDDYLDFLIEVLQKISENPNPQVIYSFLAQNIDKLDDNFRKILDTWAKNTLLSVQEEEAKNIIGNIGNFSNLIAHFSLGNIATNKEISITGYKIVLTVFTFKAFPQDWATAQNNLAIAYTERIRGDKAENLELAIFHYTEALKVRNFDTFSENLARVQQNLGVAYQNRIRGDKAENLEKAITLYREALKVRTLEVFPQQWAMTKQNLAGAYFERIRGNKAENLESAIATFSEALKVHTLEDVPYQWAVIKNNLGNVYSERIKGNKAENLELAITTFSEALKVRTLEDFPFEWAMTKQNLASAYFDRIKGEKADNLELAIFHYTEALKIYNLADFPYEWAITQSHLGNAYSERIRGRKAENLEFAITAFSEALKVCTFEAFPQDWAMTKHNLASTYLERIKGDRAENLELAIATFTEALKVRNVEDCPQDWAMTKHSLATAYCDRIRGEKAENLELAITYHQEALKVRTFEVFPIDWAATQNNLANTYTNRIRGNKEENLEQAIKYYRNALKIYTKEDDTLNCLGCASNLAKLHSYLKQWQPAIEAYHTAIEAVENTRLEALNPQSRQEVLSNAIDVFHRIVQAYLNLDQPEKALEYIERSKGRNLVELMTQKGLKPQNVSQETIDKLAELKQQVVNEQIRLQHQSINQNLIQNDNLTPYVQDHSYLKEYQQELDTFIDENITHYDPTFSLTQKVQSIPFKDIKSLTDDSTSLLQWYITGENILAFIVSADEMVKVWQSSEDDRNQLIDTLNNYLQIYYSKDGKKEWITQLPDLLQDFSDTLHINQIISLIPETCQRLIVIPHWFLHILPIHALPIDNNCILQDKYDIQYAPSCQLLQITKQRPLNQLTNLFAIQNPTKDRPFVDFGMESIRHFFSPHDYVLSGNQASKTNLIQDSKLKTVNCFHFFGHGEYNAQSPLESALILANNESLTLSEIFDLKLEKCRLVILSACETGIIDIDSISDEYLGLPSGFIFAGTPNIISSLWVVDSVSTAFLMIELYENINQQSKQNNIDITTALKNSQNKLREMTNEQFKQRLNQYKSQLDTIKHQLSDEFEKMEFEAILEYRQSKSYPFSHPFDWAAFVAIGP